MYVKTQCMHTEMRWPFNSRCGSAKELQIDLELSANARYPLTVCESSLAITQYVTFQKVASESFLKA